MNRSENIQCKRQEIKLYQDYNYSQTVKGGCKQGKNNFKRNLINFLKELFTITAEPITRKWTRIIQEVPNEQVVHGLMVEKSV